MKKAIALLLALLLVPVSGLAEALQWTITLEIAPMNEFLSTIPVESTDESETQFQAILDAANALLSSISVRVTCQQNAARLELLMRDGTLLDATAVLDDTGFALSSSLIPGVKLVWKPDQAQVRQMADAVARVDWPALGQRLAECFDEWLAGCAPAVTETGSFAGDAYERGVKRTLYRFDDRDLAMLLSAAGAALNADAAVQNIIRLLGDSLTTALDEAREFNRTVGLRNEYHYQLSLVEREDGALCGVSLTVLRAGEEQVSTLSVGFTENDTRLVWGYGLEDVNYYADLTVSVLENTQLIRRTEINSAVYEDPAFAGYQAAKQGEPVWSLLAQEVVETVADHETVSDMTMTVEGRDLPQYRYEIYEEVGQSPFQGQSTSTMYIDNARYLTETITGEMVEAFDPAQDDLREISLLPEISAQDQADLAEILQEGLSTLTVQLFKLAPPEVLTVFMMQGIGLPTQSE